MTHLNQTDMEQQYKLLLASMELEMLVQYQIMKSKNPELETLQKQLSLDDKQAIRSFELSAEFAKKAMNTW